LLTFVRAQPKLIAKNSDEVLHNSFSVITTEQVSHININLFFFNGLGRFFCSLCWSGCGGGSGGFGGR